MVDMSRVDAMTVPRVSIADLALRLGAAACLAISSYVHLHLAHLYSGVGGTLSQGHLFYAQGVVVAAVALWVLVTGHRLAWVTVALVGAASFAAVMLYRYVDVGAIGPIPNMYEPTWQPSPDKVMSAWAELAAVVIAAAAFVRRVVHRR